MWFNLLAEALPTREVEVGEAALLALIGYAIVFFGIAFLIFVVWAVGKIINAVNDSQKAKSVTSVPQKELAPVANNFEEGISEETLAVLTAAITAYYQQTQQKCEFTVKRIKRI